MDSITLSSLVRKELGVDTVTRVNPQLSSIGVTAAVALRQNPNRIWATFVNLSANTVYIGPFRDVSSTKGIALAPNGGAASLYWKEDFDLCGWEWSIVASGAASDVLIVEQLTAKNQDKIAGE